VRDFVKEVAPVHIPSRGCMDAVLAVIGKHFKAAKEALGEIKF
jgi:hypothetical protein